MKTTALLSKRVFLPILLVLLLCMAGVTNALAQTFTVGNLNYSINDDGNTVTVTGHADGSSATGQLVIPESVELYGNSYPVTRIGSYAFDYCTGLTGSLVIPNSVTQIDERAIRGCYGITQVTFGNGLTNLGFESFMQAGIIGEVTIPSSVTYIDSRVFGECSGLTTLNYNAVWAEGWLGEGYNNWLYGTSLSTVNIGEGVQRIPDCFLCDVNSLPVNQIALPESVTHIGSGAFYNFTGSVNIPSQVQVIGGSAFSNCTGLTGNLNLPETLVEVQNYAFFNCTGLTGSLTIPNSVQTIGEYAFNGCTNLSGTLTIGASLQSIYQYAFFGFMNNITEIQSYAMTPPHLGSNVFLGSNAQMPVYVPCGTLEAYQNATGWISFANIQEANPCQWEITVAANPSVGGTVSGGGTFVQGTSCTLTATAIGDFEFASWTENGAVVSTDAVYTFTVESNRDLVANFTNPNYIVFVDPNVEARCVQLWDTDGDGFLSYDEAAAVTDLNRAFEYRGITSFNELQYFTGLTYLNDYEFYSCNNLASIIIPASVTSIGYGSFSNCNNLPSITIPESVIYIDRYAFDGSGLTSLNYNATNCSVSWEWLDGCNLTNLTIGDNVQVIPEGFAYNRGSLVGELVIPASVTYIGDYAFAYCTGFTGTLTLPASLTSIGVFAFYNCTGFTGSLALPVSLASIGEKAFENCTGFTGTLTIPESVTSIGTRAFANTGFSTVNFNATNCTFMGDNFNNPVFADCAALTTLNIGENVEIIPGSAFAYCSNLTGNLTIPNSVTSIERHAFKGCTGFNGNLSLSNALTWIGSNAFQQCNFIGELTIPNTVEYIGVGAFIDCHGFTGTLTIGTDVTKIGVSAFRRCTGITAVQYNAINCQINTYDGDEFDGSWYYVNDYVSRPIFNECSNLSTIIIGEQVENIPACAFMKCSSVTGELTIPSSVQSIGNFAFGTMGISTVNFNATNCTDFSWENWWDDDEGVYYEGSVFLQCDNLSTVNFGNNVQRIPANAFNGYSSLTGALVIPSSVMEIGFRAFSGCSGLTGALTLPNAVASIGGYAFNGCGGLTGSLVIPNLVSYIGEYAFNGCNGLEGTLTIGNSVSEIGSCAFTNTALTTLNYQAANCTSIGGYDWYGNASVFYNFTTVDFSDNVESIPYRAFLGCTNLTGNLILPNSLITIGDQAFCGCYGLEGIVMGNSVETIGSEAFRNCGGLRSELTLPETLLSVGPSAFAGCNEISTVNYNAVNCQTMGNASQNVFADCLSLAHLYIGENVQSIPNYAFKPCFLITDMNVAAQVPPTIYASTFGAVPRNIPVSVPYGTGEAYRSAQYWEEFFKIVEDYSPSPYTYHWNVNAYQFGDNMTVTGIIQIDGEEQTVPSLEIGAFCNGECRGRQLLTYYPQVDRYLVFLMLYGEDGDIFTFKLYDHEAGEELTAGCTSVITFETDAIMGSFLDPYVFNFSDVQLSQFSQGYNWWSTYVEQSGIDGLEMLENSLDDNGLAIRSQANGFNEYYAGYGWYGSLSSINNESSYRVITNAPCIATISGPAALPSQHPITFGQGWTWIGYVPTVAMDINAALGNLEATLGDKVKSQHGYSDYYPGYGWFGSLNTIEPGMGLMYYSANSIPVTFTYPDSRRGGELRKNLTAEDNHWKPNIYAYPDNMTVMAVVELDDTELASDKYELAAFAANGECRGSVKLVFAEPLHRYVAFLTISGKDAAELNFRLYDKETNEEYYDAEESLDFAANAIVGGVDDLYTIHFRGTTGMDEFAGKVRVYPNPVNCGEQFRISWAGDMAKPVRVEIINALGVVETVHATSLQTLTAPNVAGVYTMRITCEEGTCYRKVVVR